MKSWFLALLMAAVALALAPSVAEAKRFGGGSSKGMQRSAPAKPVPQTPPSQAPTPTNAAPAGAGTAAAGTAAAAGKRSWMGPIAGLARTVAHEIPVPVLDGVSCAMRLAEALVDLAPRPASRGSFARPAAKPSRGLTPALRAWVERSDAPE